MSPVLAALLQYLLVGLGVLAVFLLFRHFVIKEERRNDELQQRLQDSITLPLQRHSAKQLAKEYNLPFPEEEHDGS